MENKGMGIQICLVCKKEVSQFIALMGEFHPIKVKITFTMPDEKTDKSVMVSRNKIGIKPKTVKLYMCPHCGNIIGKE